MPKQRNRSCPACGADRIEEVTGDFTTQIEGPDGKPLALSVPRITWRHCASCGEDFLDEDASEAITAAHRAALKLLTAEEIRSLRHRLGKTQTEMSDLLGIGEKTYCRWESGTHFQSEAFDRYLRLLEEPSVVDLLTQIKLEKQGAEKSAASTFAYLKISAYDSVSEIRKRSAPAAWLATKSA